MSAKNSVTLEGNLTADPKFNVSPNAVAYCWITIAVNEAVIGKDGQAKAIVNYFPVTLFGKQALFARDNLKKGSFVNLAGSLSYGKRADTGNYEFSIRCNFLKNLSNVAAPVVPAEAV